MTNDAFVLGDLKLNPGIVRRDTYLGIHSGRELSKFEVNLSTGTPAQTASVEQLLEKKRVQCFDPEQQRAFDVELTLQSSSYQSGRPEKRFSIAASEIDTWPVVENVEIEGIRFAVSQYRETDEGEGRVGRHAILTLNDEELRQLRQLVRPGRVSVRRVGVDTEPLSLRFGGMQCWSENTVGDQGKIKQIVRFYSADPDPKSPPFASAVIQQNTALLAIEAAHKLNCLVDELRRNGVLSEKKASEYRVVVKAPNAEQDVFDDWWWRLDKVRDASDYL